MLNGGPIVWNSKLQTVIALSTTESEVYAMTEGIQEALWLRQFLENVTGNNSNEPIVIYEDNKGTRDLANNRSYQKRTRHIDVRHYFVRDYIEKGLIRVDQIKSEFQLADFLTKTLGYKELMKQLSKIMQF